MPPLVTERLLLREFTLEDATFVHALMNSPGWLRYIGDRQIHSPADAQRYLQNGPLASYARWGFGLRQVLKRDTAERAGMCGLLRREALPDIELGFAFASELAGRGYATEAARAVLTDAHERLGLRRIAAVVQPDNIASLRVLAKLGFQFERVVQLAPNAPPLHLLACEPSAAREPATA